MENLKTYRTSYQISYFDGEKRASCFGCGYLDLPEESNPIGMFFDIGAPFDEPDEESSIYKVALPIFLKKKEEQLKESYPDVTDFDIKVGFFSVYEQKN